MNKRVCALFFLLCLSFGVLFVKMAELCGGNVSDVAASKNTVGVTVLRQGATFTTVKCVRLSIAIPF